jgi:hypothetical protein
MTIIIKLSLSSSISATLSLLVWFIKSLTDILGHGNSGHTETDQGADEG